MIKNEDKVNNDVSSIYNKVIEKYIGQHIILGT